ncbi:MAG: hypothetical protein AB1489_33960 [Acidobacteriota bacterium]
MSTPTFALSSSAAVTPLSNNFSADAVIQSVLTAAQGGPATSSYFDTINIFSSLFGQLQSQGPSGWESATDVNGLPIYYVKQEDEQGNNYYVALQCNITVDSGNLNVNSSTQTINGVTYNGIGAVTLTTGYNATDLSQISWWLGLAVGSTVVLTALLSGLSQLINSTANNLAAQIANFDNDFFNGGDDDGYDTEEDISTAESDASTAISEEADVVIAESSIGLSFIGIGIAIAIAFIMLSFFLHATYQRVRLWNLTRYNAIWSLWFDEGILVTGPVTFNSDGSIASYMPFAPVCNGSPVPGALPINQAVYGDMYFTSNSELHGLGYAMQIQLLDPADSSIVYTCTLMFDIPYIGNNSTSVTFDTVTDLSSYYTQQEGVNQVYTVQASSSDNLITCTTTYDILDGEQPLPPPFGGNGTNEGYFYQSVILLYETDLNPDNICSCNQSISNIARVPQYSIRGYRRKSSLRKA